MTVAGPLLTEDQDRPYEYRTFAVGDRVRVRLSPECQAKFRRFNLIGEVVESGLPHDLGQDGKAGTIIMMPLLSYKPDSDHPHLVEFDTPYEGPNGNYQLSGGFASSELEPLDPEAQ